MSTTADHLIDRHDAVDSRSSSEPTPPLPPSAQRSKCPTHRSAARGLILETILVTIGTVAVVSVLHARGASGPQWILIPSVLVAAALVPAWIGKREFPCVGLHRDHAWAILKTVGGVSACILPAVFLGLWVLTSLLKLPLPLPPVSPPEQH